MVEDIKKALMAEIAVSINSVVNNHKYALLDPKMKKKIIKKVLKQIINRDKQEQNVEKTLQNDIHFGLTSGV